MNAWILPKWAKWPRPSPLFKFAQFAFARDHVGTGHPGNEADIRVPPPYREVRQSLCIFSKTRLYTAGS